MKKLSSIAYAIVSKKHPKIDVLDLYSTTKDIILEKDEQFIRVKIIEI